MQVKIFTTELLVSSKELSQSQNEVALGKLWMAERKFAD